MGLDKGFIEYSPYNSWMKHKIWFVTRLRCHEHYRVVERRPPVQWKCILADDIIAWTNFYAHKNCPQHLRRIVI